MSDNPQLILLIAGQYYRVERIHFGGEKQSRKGWKLTHFEDKQQHGPYSVISGAGTCTCDCADATFVRSKTNDLCKHARTLIQIGLLP